MTFISHLIAGLLAVVVIVLSGIGHVFDLPEGGRLCRLVDCCLVVAEDLSR